MTQFQDMPIRRDRARGQDLLQKVEDITRDSGMGVEVVKGDYFKVIILLPEDAYEIYERALQEKHLKEQYRRD